MKKISALLLGLVMTFSLAACSGDSPTSQESKEQVKTDNDSIVISSLNGDRKEVEVEVPLNPERIAVMDLAVLDMLDNFGLGDRIVGVSKGSSIDYLQDYITDDSIVNLGTLKEASLEAVMECEPDVIFIGGRLSSFYDEFSEIAPVVFLSTDAEIGLVESIKKNATTVASIFGVEDNVTDMMKEFDSRITALSEFSEGKNAFIGMLNAGGFNVLGNDGRCSLIGVEAGFENIGLDVEKDEGTVTSAHGNETSFEYILRLDPDYIFVMNRDDAIGTEGASTAQEVIENELVMKTSAYQNGNIVYLEHSNVWYTAEGGITALDYMLKDLEKVIK